MYVASIFLFFGVGRSFWQLAERKFLRRNIAALGKSAIAWFTAVIWMVGSGWAIHASEVAEEPGWPITGNSTWVDQSVDWDGGLQTGCIALDPWAWGAFGPSCKVTKWTDYRLYSPSNIQEGFVDIGSLSTVPAESRVSSIAIAIDSEKDAVIDYVLSIALANDLGSIEIIGTKSLSLGGNTLSINMDDEVPVHQVSSVLITVSNGKLHLDPSGLTVLSYVTVQTD